VIKPEIEFMEDCKSGDDEDVYLKGKENLDLFLSNHLIQDEEESYYIYSIQLGDHIQYGICGGIKPLLID